MNPIVLPWQEGADFRFEMALDRHVYILRFRWNDVAKSWAFDLHTRAQRALFLGARVVAGVDLLGGMNMAFAPPGALIVIGEEPGYDSFLNNASQIVYLPAEVVNAL